MTPKQQRFVEEYLIDLNATAAYQRAGYKAKGHAAETNATRLLRNAEVQAAIQAARLAQQERTQITADRVLNEYALLGFSDIGQIIDFSGETPRLRPANQIPDGARRAIRSMKVKRYAEGHGANARQVEVMEFTLWSKETGLTKLGDHLGIDAPKKHQFEDVTPVQAKQKLKDKVMRLRAMQVGPSPNGVNHGA